MKKIKRRKSRIFFKRVRNVICVICMFVLMFKATMVDAGIDDSVIQRNRVDGIYAVTKINGVDRIFYLNMYTLNGHVAYCIELGVDITSDIYNSTSDFSISNLTKEQIDYIRNVSYFGYGFDDQYDIRYYMAAQEIIWEYLGDVQVKWTNVLDVNGEEIDLTVYKNSIYRFVNPYMKGINFSGYREGMVVNGGDKIVIKDNNYILGYFDIINGEHCDVKVENYNIHIYFDNDYVGKDIVTLKRKRIYDYDSNLYYQGDSQKLISSGNIGDEVILTFDIRGKDVIFQLVDNIDVKHNSQFDYLGINFELYSSNGVLIDVLKSDEDGNSFINNLAYGNYYVKQISTNDAYLLGSNTKYFEINNNDEVIFFEVEPIVNEIEILKLYGDRDNYFEESEIIFEFYNIDGSFYDSVITLENGIGSISVPYGEYIVKQKNSSVGYAKVDDFYIDGREDYNEVINYTLVDELIKTNLVINSKDVNGNFILEDGISYNIKKSNNDGVNVKSIAGIAEVENKLEYGKYIVEVINNTNNYKSEFLEVEFVIDDNSNFEFRNGELYLTLDVLYSMKKGSMNINSFKEEVFFDINSYYYDYVKDGNLNLELVVDEDIIINNEIVYNKEDIVVEFVTDKDGNYVIDDIYFGKYCLIDRINSTKNCFILEDEEELDVEIKRDINKGNINIHNLSSDMENIMGTVIELSSDNGQVVYVGATNEDGIIKINDLMYGDYCFREKSVNNEYLLNEDEVCFSVDKEELLKLEIVNNRIGKRLISVPDTFSDKESVKKLIILILILLGGIIYKIKGCNKFN